MKNVFSQSLSRVQMGDSLQTEGCSSLPLGQSLTPLQKSVTGMHSSSPGHRLKPCLEQVSFWSGKLESIHQSALVWNPLKSIWNPSAENDSLEQFISSFPSRQFGKPLHLNESWRQVSSQPKWSTGHASVPHDRSSDPSAQSFTLSHHASLGMHFQVWLQAIRPSGHWSLAEAMKRSDANYMVEAFRKSMQFVLKEKVINKNIKLITLTRVIKNKNKKETENECSFQSKSHSSSSHLRNPSNRRHRRRDLNVWCKLWCGCKPPWGTCTPCWGDSFSRPRRPRSPWRHRTSWKDQCRCRCSSI